MRGAERDGGVTSYGRGTKRKATKCIVVMTKKVVQRGGVFAEKEKSSSLSHYFSQLGEVSHFAVSALVGVN